MLWLSQVRVLLAKEFIRPFVEGYCDVYFLTSSTMLEIFLSLSVISQMAESQVHKRKFNLKLPPTYLANN